MADDVAHHDEENKKQGAAPLEDVGNTTGASGPTRGGAPDSLAERKAPAGAGTGVGGGPLAGAVGPTGPAGRDVENRKPVGRDEREGSS